MPVIKNLSLSLPFFVDSDVYKKLESYAEKHGITIHEAFQSVATMGMYGHISRNLDFLDKYDI